MARRMTLPLLGAATFPKPSSLTATDCCIGIAVSGEGAKRSLTRLCIQQRETYASRGFASNKLNILRFICILSHMQRISDPVPDLNLSWSPRS
jgi:hypothetical protein